MPEKWVDIVKQCSGQKCQWTRHTVKVGLPDTKLISIALLLAKAENEVGFVTKFHLVANKIRRKKKLVRSAVLARMSGETRRWIVVQCYQNIYSPQASSFCSQSKISGTL